MALDDSAAMDLMLHLLPAAWCGFLSGQWEENQRELGGEEWGAERSQEQQPQRSGLRLSDFLLGPGTKLQRLTSIDRYHLSFTQKKSPNKSYSFLSFVRACFYGDTWAGVCLSGDVEVNGLFCGTRSLPSLLCESRDPTQVSRFAC